MRFGQKANLSRSERDLSRHRVRHKRDRAAGHRDQTAGAILSAINRLHDILGFLVDGRRYFSLNASPKIAFFHQQAAQGREDGTPEITAHLVRSTEDTRLVEALKKRARS